MLFILNNISQKYQTQDILLIYFAMIQIEQLKITIKNLITTVSKKISCFNQVISEKKIYYTTFELYTNLYKTIIIFHILYYNDRPIQSEFNIEKTKEKD